MNLKRSHDFKCSIVCRSLFTDCTCRCEQATCKHERKIASLRAQQQSILKRLSEAEARFLDNDGWLHRVENDIKLLQSDERTTQVSAPRRPLHI